MHLNCVMSGNMRLGSESIFEKVINATVQY